MKITIGQAEIAITRMDISIYKGVQHVNCTLKETAETAVELDRKITNNFTGNLVFDNESVQEEFTEMEYQGMRKNYDSNGTFACLDFEKNYEK